MGNNTDRKNKNGYVISSWKAWSINLLFRIIAKVNDHTLGKVTHKSIIEEEVWVPMSDGVKLHALVIRPRAKGKYPVIMVRNPYVINDFLYRALLPLFTRRGYVCVLNSVRGTLASEGEWEPLIHEDKDGRDFVEWISGQSWCDGNIGGYGGSYLGYVQLGIADCGHPALKTLFIAVAGASPYHTFWRRGMFRQEIWNYWAVQMMEDNRYYMKLPPELYREALSYEPQIKLGEHIKGIPCNWYKAWVTSDSPDAAYWTHGYWGHIRNSVSDIKIPVMLQGGWFDIFLRAQMNMYKKLPADIRQKSRFLIGPWDHGGKVVGQKKLSNTDKGGMFCTREALEWFDYQLKGREYKEKLGGIEAYNIGNNRWEYYSDKIVPENYIRYYFAGHAGKSYGMLSNSTGESTRFRYYYDPKDPVKSYGGNVLGTGVKNKDIGPVEQKAIGSRPDVISFVSEPLKAEMQLAGSIKAHLVVSSDAPATAFTICISEADSGGHTLNIRDDISDIRWRDEDTFEKYRPGEKVSLELELIDILWKVKAGSRIRVDISSSNYPIYHTHPNSAEPWAMGPEKRIAMQTVFCGGEDGSYIEFPIL